MFVFGLAGVLVVGRELWLYHAGPETLEATAPLDAATAQPLISPEMRTDPTAPTHPVIRMDHAMAPEPARTVTTHVAEGALQRCEVNGNVVYVTGEGCPEPAAPPAAPTPSPGATGPAGSADARRSATESPPSPR